MWRNLKTFSRADQVNSARQNARGSGVSDIVRTVNGEGPRGREGPRMRMRLNCSRRIVML